MIKVLRLKIGDSSRSLRFEILYSALFMTIYNNKKWKENTNFSIIRIKELRVVTTVVNAFMMATTTEIPRSCCISCKFEQKCQSACVPGLIQVANVQNCTLFVCIPRTFDWPDLYFRWIAHLGQTCILIRQATVVRLIIRLRINTGKQTDHPSR